jgi:outer membrane protein TolC
MHKNFEIAPSRPAVSPLRLKAAYLAALLSAPALSGCATFSPDGGMTVVANIADETLNKDVISILTAEDAEAARSAVQHLLRRSLTVDTAVQIALLNNRGLQAAYNELALAEADMVQESLPPNPTFSIFRITGDSVLEAERQIVGNILALSTLPFRSEIARQRFQKAQLRAAEETLRLAADVRRAYFRAVAANELVGLLTDARSTAEATAQLASKLGQTGALNKLDQAVNRCSMRRRRPNSQRSVRMRPAPGNA